MYQPTTPGGRVRPDGTVLKWRITAPDARHGRGVLPFFCQDVTPRGWRVRCAVFACDVGFVLNGGCGCAE